MAIHLNNGAVSNEALIVKSGRTASPKSRKSPRLHSVSAPAVAAASKDETAPTLIVRIPE